MININFVCEKCGINSSDVTVDGFIIPFKSVPENFGVFLDKGKPVFLCQDCMAYYDKINEDIKTTNKRAEWVNQYHENPIKWESKTLNEKGYVVDKNGDS